MSNAVNGVGTSFYKWVGSSWTKIAEVMSIQGPGMSRDMIDVTSLDSTGGYREFIGGFRNPGVVQLGMNFTRAGYDLMNADFESDTIQNYEIRLPDVDATAIEFEGLVQELPLNIAVGAQVKVDVKIQVIGQPVVTSGGSSSPGAL